VSNLEEALRWLKEQRLTDAGKENNAWFFTFECGGGVSTEQAWRVLTSEGIVATSDDHGHQFGLPAPVDAPKRAKETIGANKVSTYCFSKGSSDLLIDFEGGAQLQLLNLSCGYESWHAVNDGVHVICMGGGNLSTYDEKVLPHPTNVIYLQPQKP
jgi:hypothetical protein